MVGRLSRRSHRLVGPDRDREIDSADRRATRRSHRSCVLPGADRPLPGVGCGPDDRVSGAGGGGDTRARGATGRGVGLLLHRVIPPHDHPERAACCRAGARSAPDRREPRRSGTRHPPRPGPGRAERAGPPGGAGPTRARRRLGRGRGAGPPVDRARDTADRRRPRTGIPAGIGAVGGQHGRVHPARGHPQLATVGIAVLRHRRERRPAADPGRAQPSVGPGPAPGPRRRGTALCRRPAGVLHRHHDRRPVRLRRATRAAARGRRDHPGRPRRSHHDHASAGHDEPGTAGCGRATPPAAGPDRAALLRCQPERRRRRGCPPRHRADHPPRRGRGLGHRRDTRAHLVHLRIPQGSGAGFPASTPRRRNPAHARDPDRSTRPGPDTHADPRPVPRHPGDPHCDRHPLRAGASHARRRRDPGRGGVRLRSRTLHRRGRPHLRPHRGRPDRTSPGTSTAL